MLIMNLPHQVVAPNEYEQAIDNVRQVVAIALGRQVAPIS
jgi:predicted RNA-binding protein associated with RNAse of E/G family